MLTNHKPSRLASKEVQAAALIGGMGKLFSLRLFSALSSFPQVVQCVFSPALLLTSRRSPAAPAILTTILALLFFTGCVSAHKKGRTIHERWDYAIVELPGCEADSFLICHEIWEDEWKGGGVAFLADPKASELVSIHTNQTALGGSSSLSIGSFQSEVSTNGIEAVGAASSQIIQGAGAAAGQLINKSVTGTPLK